MNRPRILVVEDERITAEDIKRTLEKYGYRVTGIVSTAAAAILKTEEDQPDLVLMDIVLKGKGDGIEAATHIYQRMGIPVVYLTAYSDEDTLKRAKISQPFGYVLKPFEERELYSNIEIALYKNRMEMKLTHINKVLMALREINQIITRERDKGQMIAQICRTLTESEAYSCSWAVLTDNELNPVYIAESGFTEGFDELKNWLNEKKMPDCIKSFLKKKDLAIYKKTGQCASCPIKNVKGYKDKGGFVTRLKFHETLYGFISAALPSSLVEDEEEITLFLEIAEDLGFALHQLDLLLEKKMTESKLSEMQTRFQTIIETAQDHMFIKDADLLYQMINPAMERNLGKPMEKFIGQSDKELFGSEAAEKIRAMDQRVLAGETVEVESKQIIRGKEHDFHIISVPLRNEKGDVIGISGYARDITDRKKAEQIRESLYRITQAAHSTQDLSSLYQEIFHIIDSLLEVSNFFIALVDPVSHSIRFPFYVDETSNEPSDHPDEKRLAELVIQRGESINVNKKQIQSMIESEEIPSMGISAISWLGVPMFLEGSIIGVLGVYSYDPAQILEKRDQEILAFISSHVASAIQRKKAEELLRENEERYRLVITNTGQLIYELDLESGGILWEGAFESLLGYSREEMAGFDIDWWKNQIHSEDRNRAIQLLQQSIDLGTSFNAEYRFRHKDGHYIIIADNGSFILNDEQKALRMLGAKADITARKEAEEEIMKWNLELEERVKERTAELEQSNRELESYSYTISHDLRAPLRVINGYAQMVIEDHGDALTPEAIRLLKIIQQNTRQMSQLIDDLLSFSRLGRSEVKCSRFDMAALVNGIAEEKKSHHPEWKGSIAIMDLPEAWGDPSLLRQLWVNLIDNSIKFTRNISEPRIEIGWKNDTPDGLYFIRDNGVGFDSRYREKIFQVFYRLHNPMDFEGTGVGLAIVQRVIQRHSGRIWAEGESDVGASFYFSLPECEE